MRRTARAGLAASLLLLVGCEPTNPPCGSATAEIIIEAPAATVFDVLLDTDRYPEWNPYIIEVTPPMVDISQPGAEFELRVLQPVEQIEVTSPELTVWFDDASDGNGTLAYRATGPLADLAGDPVRFQQVATLGPSLTRYTTSEQFCTFLLPALPLESVKAGFDSMAEALKHRAESQTFQEGEPAQP